LSFDRHKGWHANKLNIQYELKKAVKKEKGGKLATPLE
jgi:hypothetical protein